MLMGQECACGKVSGMRGRRSPGRKSSCEDKRQKLIGEGFKNPDRLSWFAWNRQRAHERFSTNIY